MKTSEKIYQRLQQADTYISGERLAKDLHLSRTAIWKGIKALEQQGIEIQTSKRQGYKIISGDLLLPDEIARHLGIPVIYNATSVSTQIDAKTAMTKGSTGPSLYLAPHQISAKGRLDRHFYTSKTGGIYMSLHIRPNQSYQELDPYTMIAASSIVKAIARLTGIETEIKWVNDIYLNGKKVAGILTEAIASVETGLITDVIIGIGLNFYITDMPKELSAIATSLFTETPSITRNQLIIEIWNLFLTIPLDDHIKVYKEKSLVLNRQVNYMQQGQEIQAKAIDITNQGYLIVQKKDGSLETLHSGEISLSSWTL
ncbi:MAG: bifunctional biotin--[acetyl-CoA-carboxylase] synthetase/biotin operon repressor [Streptococcus pyogenes]|nr:MAG: bifunctional biotin--[acetyl-CoA-carboxylase] synthetase/biotin operon repressor [Streptococcus pyogenes]